MLSKKRQSKLASSRARDDVITPEGPSSSVPHGPVRFPPDDPPSPPRSPSTLARPPPIEGERLLSKQQVLSKTGLSYVTIWRLMTRKRFPASRQVASKAVWVASEIDRWIRELPVVPLKQGDPDA